jgi:hypothetical protein
MPTGRAGQGRNSRAGKKEPLHRTRQAAQTEPIHAGQGKGDGHAPISGGSLGIAGRWGRESGPSWSIAPLLANAFARPGDAEGDDDDKG